MSFNFRGVNRRALAISVLVLFQLAAVMLTLCLFARRFPPLEHALRLLKFFVALYIFSRDMPPSYKLAWITLLLFAPRSGAVVYLIGGKMGFLRFFKRDFDESPELGSKINDNRQLFSKDDRFAAISVFLSRC
ncbi:MAG: PLDc_N domain-containing protein, partial [Oscillospiraceae bacterium]|nr:PLDc_N domain-containing protein [Oscillospiraceae bacterium]